MSNKCRLMETEEKGEFLSVFYDIPKALFLIDRNLKEIVINKYTYEFLKNQKICDKPCNCKEKIISWIKDEIDDINSSRGRKEFKKEIKTPNGNRKFLFIITKINLPSRYDYIIYIEDNTEEDIAEAFINQSFEITKTISNISQRFVGIYDIKKNLLLSLKDIGISTKANRVAIYEFSDDMKSILKSYEWCKTPCPNEQQKIPAADFLWIVEMLDNREFVFIEDTDNMPYNAKSESNFFKNQEIKSFIAIPLKVKNNNIGFLCISYKNKIKKWSNYDLMLLKLVADIFNNVFERQLMELKLKKSEQLFRELLQSANDAIYLIKAKGNLLKSKLLMVNDNLCNLLGYTSKELLTLKFENIIPENQKEKMDKILSIVQRKGKHEFEVLLKAKDNEEIPVEISAHIYKNNYEKILMSIARDIRERKKAEEKLKRSEEKYKRLAEELEVMNNELKETIKQLEITQMHLVQQEKMAGIGQLAAGVAHEINNPLGYVISNVSTLGKYIRKYRELFIAQSKFNKKCISKLDVELLEELNNLMELEDRYNFKFINEDIEELMAEAYEGLNKIRKIVNSLRLFSRIDYKNEFEEFELNDVIENTLLVAENEIKYYAEVEKNFGEISPIYGLVGEINQVLLNLIINATHAIKMSNRKDKGKITINTYERDKKVYCEIIDNGIGIPKKIINQIFNPFFTTKPVGQGTGLGLSISYDIIKNKHSGDIKVESIEGRGSKFTIILPTKNCY